MTRLPLCTEVETFRSFPYYSYQLLVAWHTLCRVDSERSSRQRDVYHQSRVTFFFSGENAPALALSKYFDVSKTTCGCLADKSVV